MYTVYVLKSLVKEIHYVGYTDDMPRRLIEHNAGKSKFTSAFKPWVIVYTEQVPDSIKARVREKYLKSYAGRQFIKRHRGSTPD